MAKKIKLRILNDGGFFGFENVKFPVEVESEDIEPYLDGLLVMGYEVPWSIIPGVNPETVVYETADDTLYFSRLGNECEEIV